MTRLIERGIVRPGAVASSAMFEQGLDARVGHGADRQAAQEVLPGRRDAPLDLVDEQPRLQQQDQSDEHDQHLRHQVEQ